MFSQIELPSSRSSGGGDLCAEKLREGTCFKKSAELVNDLGINSLELADLVFTCESKYNIEIDEDDYRKFVTVGDVIAYLEAQKA